MKKLSAEDLSVLSDGLIMQPRNGYFDKLFYLVLCEIKVKVDRKMANGQYSAKGYSIKLTPAQTNAAMLLNILAINQRKDVQLQNALHRLIAMNNK